MHSDKARSGPGSASSSHSSRKPSHISQVFLYLSCFSQSWESEPSREQVITLSLATYLPPSPAPLVALRETFTNVHRLAFAHAFQPLLVGWGGETHTQAAAWPRLWPRSHQKLVANPSGTGNHSSCHYQMTPRCRLPSEPWRRQHLNALITVHMSLDWDAQPRSCLQLELKGVW